MPTILLDTDVVSFLIKGDTRATTYAPLVQGNTLAVSFMAVAELFQWATVRHWGPRRLNHLEQALAAYLVVPVDIEMCRIWELCVPNDSPPERLSRHRMRGSRRLPYATICRSSRTTPVDYQGVATLDVR